MALAAWSTVEIPADHQVAAVCVTQSPAEIWTASRLVPSQPMLDVLPSPAHSPLAHPGRECPLSCGRGCRTMESPSMGPVWLAEIAVWLVYWVAGLIGRAFRRKRGGPRTDGAPVHTEEE